MGGGRITKEEPVRVGEPVRFVDIVKRGSGRHDQGAPVFQKEKKIRREISN
jgi:hypothetical protein